MKRKPGDYTENRLLRSPLTGNVYFVRRARLLPNGGFVAVSEKIDVTEDFYVALNQMPEIDTLVEKGET